MILSFFTFAYAGTNYVKCEVRKGWSTTQKLVIRDQLDDQIWSRSLCADSKSICEEFLMVVVFDAVENLVELRGFQTERYSEKDSEPRMDIFKQKIQTKVLNEKVEFSIPTQISGLSEISGHCVLKEDMHPLE